MTTRTIETTAANDIALDVNGNVSIVTGLDAVIGNCKTAIQAQRGEMQYAVNTGMPTLATAWENYNPIQFEAAARTILKAVPDVIEVESFSTTRSGEALRYTAVIRTIYGRGSLNG